MDRTRIASTPLIGCLVLAMAGCSGSGPGTQAPGPTAASTQLPLESQALDSVDQLPTDEPSPSPLVGGGGGGGGGGTGGGGGSNGGGPNTVVYQWSDRTDKSGNGVADLITTSYKAIVHITLTKTDIYSYAITGSADISGTFTEDYRNGCSHYTDDAHGNDTVEVQGGLQWGEIGDPYGFQLSVLGSYAGTNHAVRDDSACGGPDYVSDPEWPLPAVNVPGGDGTLTDVHHMTGNASIPREGGTETVAWDFTVP